MMSLIKLLLNAAKYHVVIIGICHVERKNYFQLASRQRFVYRRVADLHLSTTQYPAQVIDVDK